jgi:uncharacterized protein (DUF1800 family)
MRTLSVKLSYKPQDSMTPTLKRSRSIKTWMNFAWLAAALFAAPAALAQIQSGWWYNPGESGRGYFIEQQGSSLFMAAFLYDSSGNATWVGSTGTIDGMAYQGSLFAYANGQTLTGAYIAPVTTPSPGDISIVFSDASHGTLTWPEGSIPIERFAIVAGGLSGTAPGNSPITGWYWNPAESGRGYAYEVQNGTLLYAAFMYSASGEPIWYMSEGAVSGVNLYQGEWQQYANGQSLLGAYKAPIVINSQIGALTLQFIDTADATMTLPQGTQIPITHFLFSQVATPPPIGAEPAQISVSPSAAIFGSQGLNTTSPAQMLTLTNTGGATANLQLSLGGNNPGDFKWFGTCTNNMNLASGSSCSLSLTFTPLAAGARTAAISVQAGASDAVQIVAVSGGGTPSTAADTVRFLNQATFGPTAPMLSYVQNVGIAAFLEEQFAAPITGYPNFPYYPQTAPQTCTYNSMAPTSAASLCSRDNYSLFQVQLHMFQNALTAPDQLRQRVAWALSQIMVTSGLENQMAYAMGDYQQILLNNAFGNFRDILYQVTLSPEMGNYLNMVNNDKANPKLGTSPNENYARELMQLFSLGLSQLNIDGTPVLDSSGQPVPTYSQATVTAFAAIYTGWSYAPLPGVAQGKSSDPVYWGAPMVAFEANHDETSKTLLNGYVTAAGQTAETDLNTAIDNIFNHPNVGPFIGGLLIQALITSNPSPGYVSRVATAFNNNGQGVRGDMKAVLRAILLDTEARGDVSTNPSFGHLREPVLFMTGVLRALDGASDGEYLSSQANTMEQEVFFSPSVFNYYPPNYNIPGTTLLGPEFGIQNAATTFARANFVNTLVFGTGSAADPTVVGSIGTSVDMSSLIAIGDPVQMIGQINTLMFAGNMSAGLQNAILTAVLAYPATDLLDRARTAVYLAVTSPQYQVIQ